MTTTLETTAPSRPESTGGVSRLLLAEEIARLLRVSPRTLETWRRLGTGPRFLKIGGRVFYQPSAIDAYLAAAERASTRNFGIVRRAERVLSLNHLSK